MVRNEVKMGQGKETKTRADPEVEIQERGEIFFFYRPKIGREEAHGPDDVQRMYIVLCPESGERSTEEKQASDSGKEGAFSQQPGGSSREDKEKDDDDDDDKKAKSGGEGTEGGHGSETVNIEKQRLFRFIVMGRKSLPEPNKHSCPYWRFVEMVTTKVEDIKTALKGEEYDTATHGHRRTSPARAFAEGIYRILRHKSGRKTHTHLVYNLEFPPGDETGEPQETMNVERESSFLIQVKNPDQKGAQFRGIQTKRKAVYPAHLQGQFGQLRYSAADPPDFLNYEGCEFLLIAASDDIDEELGLELKTEEGDGREECSDVVKIFGESVASRPLLSGTWV